MKKFTLHFILFCIIIVASACKTLQRTDDALRIKKDSSYKYTTYPFNTNIIRNGNTLRGMVLRLETLMTPDSCVPGRNPNYKVENRVVFLDVKSPNLRYLEYIPFEDVDFIGPKFGQPINSFEDYNFPLEPKRFRYVPWDTMKVECLACNCTPFSLSFNLPCLFCPECPTRVCKWYFVELRGGYSTYRDKMTPTTQIWKDGFFGELSAGFRFGNKRQYALGILFSTGLPIYNSFTSEDIRRPMTLLHFRWDPFRNCIKPRPKTQPIRVREEDECICPEDIQKKGKSEKLDLPFEKCFNPYFYVQSGIPIDRFSIDLLKLNLSRSDCRDRISASAPYLNVKTMPVTFTIGVGVDYPVSSYVDISIDAGWRSYAFGESQAILGFSNVPSFRRINMFFIRTGITL